MENLSFVQWTWAELNANGVGTELQEYLNANGVTKDELVLEMEKYPDATVEASIGTIKMRQEVAPVVEEVASEDSKLPSEEPAVE